jgi:hypothetical protein
MPQFSAFTSFGFFEFSSQPSLHEQIYNLIPQLYGQPHDMTVVGSYEEAKRYALAMVFALMLTENRHAGNQKDPRTAYDLLPLLERDFLLTPGAKDSLQARQNALLAAMLLPGGAKASNVVQAVRTLIGNAFLAYVPNPAGQGHQTVHPTSPGTGPGAFKDNRLPAKLVKLVDPVSMTGAPLWVAYTALDPTTLPTVVWSPGASFQEGQFVLPTTTGANGFFFLASSDGQTGTVEPVWPSVVGQTVVDGGVTWTCAATVAPGLQKGDVVVVDPSNTLRMEKLTVTGVSFAPPTGQNVTPGNANLFFQARFASAHDAGVPITTGTIPYWWSTQRFNLIVATAAAALDPPSRTRLDGILAKILRGVSSWAIVAPSSTTPTGGTIGPLSAGMGMGTTTVGAVNFTNTN